MGTFEIRRDAVCKDCLLCNTETHGKVSWYFCECHNHERIRPKQRICRDFVFWATCEPVIEKMIESARERGYSEVADKAEELYKEHRRMKAWLCLNEELYKTSGGWNCTNVSQSTELEKILGFEHLDTADGFYVRASNGYEWDYTPVFDEERWKYNSTLPCWSLDKMLSLVMENKAGYSLQIVGSGKMFNVVCKGSFGEVFSAKSDFSLTDAVFKVFRFLAKENKLF